MIATQALAATESMTALRRPRQLANDSLDVDGTAHFGHGQQSTKIRTDARMVGQGLGSPAKTVQLFTSPPECPKNTKKITEQAP